MFNIKEFTANVKTHLQDKLLPFWMGLQDQEFGGYYGYMDYELQLDKKAVKGCILNSRILWTFSNAYKQDPKIEYLKAAQHAYKFMVEHCFDHEFGGIYWSMTYDGKPSDTTKHTYNQAFAIYALSSYYDITKDPQVLEQAFSLYQIIEHKCKDARGYLESFNVKFEPEDNSKLSENGVIASRTMNTLLHVFEAYTELYRVTKNQDVRTLQVKGNLLYMLDLIDSKIFNEKLGRQEVFFDDQWNSLIDLYSYGHDIETSWLIDRCLKIVDEPSYTARMSKVVNTLAQQIYNIAYKNHSLMNECEKGVDNTRRIWWVQAETVVGFLNAYENLKDPKFLEAAHDVYQYIMTYLVDPRSGSEWFWSVDENGNPEHLPIVEPWKCPYHNGRMCFEVLRRLQHVA